MSQLLLQFQGILLNAPFRMAGNKLKSETRIFFWRTSDSKFKAVVDIAIGHRT